MKRLIILLILSIGFQLYSYSAYLRDIPQTITQPDGTKIECFASGDEFYNWVHDADGYTIVRNNAGYYCYAILEGGELVASQYVVGTVSPKSVSSLTPNTRISVEKIKERVKRMTQNRPQKEMSRKSGSQSRATNATETLNNIVIYVRFADQPEFQTNQSTYTDLINDTTIGANSMRNYFREVSYGQLDIVSHFYQVNNGTTIVSYQDSENRNYYCPYDVMVNPNGYDPDNFDERKRREHVLLHNAVKYVDNLKLIPTSLDLSYNYNSTCNVGNICFMIQGSTETAYEGSAGAILWPHKWELSSYEDSINGKRVWTYNVNLEKNLLPHGNNGVLCHEMFHSLGAPDLYHYNYDGAIPVGGWDLMAGQYTDNVTFEAGEGVTLNPGFKVEAGGTFKINIKACDE